MNRNDGGQAFPRTGSGSLDYSAVDGMTLRDYFAAKAMKGLIEDRVKTEGEESFGFSIISKESYEIADAMLKAREVK